MTTSQDSREIFCLTLDEIEALVMTSRLEAWTACLQEVKSLASMAGPGGDRSKKSYQTMIIVNSLETSGRFNEIFKSRSNLTTRDNDDGCI